MNTSDSLYFSLSTEGHLWSSPGDRIPNSPRFSQLNHPLTKLRFDHHNLRFGTFKPLNTLYPTDTIVVVLNTTIYILFHAILFYFEKSSDFPSDFRNRYCSENKNLITIHGSWQEMRNPDFKMHPLRDDLGLSPDELSFLEKYRTCISWLNLRSPISDFPNRRTIWFKWFPIWIS